MSEGEVLGVAFFCVSSVYVQIYDGAIFFVLHCIL